jgi:glycerophosphoryl diester phosphodiesterase
MTHSIDSWYQGRTLIFGHRGASAYAPQNTLPAFELAAEQGADGIELDVWLSKDRQLVILHDSTLDHTTNSTGYIWDKTLVELKDLDASHSFKDKYGVVVIPTLDEVFEAVGKRLLINVEIKADAGMISGVEQAVADKIAYFGLEQRTIVSSFSADVLRNFRGIKPEVAIGFLHAEETPAEQWEIINEMIYEARHPHHTLIDDEYMTYAKSQGWRVNTWTVNDAARGLELQQLGVDAIITNHPDMLLRALRG